MVEPFFIFKNINSLDLGIVIKDEWLPPVIKASDDVEIIEVPGRDGYLTISKNRKKPILKTVTAVLIDEHKKHEVRNWLYGEGRLILSNESDAFYKARIINSPEYYDYWGYGWQFDVEFLCQPWAYLLTGETIITITEKNTVIHNLEGPSQPLIKIYGNGPVDLIVNDKIHKFDNVEEYAIIDSELMEVYKETSPVKYYGEFPEFVPGENIVSWDGNVSKLEIIPRWRR